MFDQQTSDSKIIYLNLTSQSFIMFLAVLIAILHFSSVYSRSDSMQSIYDYMRRHEVATREYCRDSKITEQQANHAEQCQYTYLFKYNARRLSRMFCEEKFTTSALQRRSVYCASKHGSDDIDSYWKLDEQISKCTVKADVELGCHHDERYEDYGDPVRCKSSLSVRRLFASPSNVFTQFVLCFERAIGFDSQVFEENRRANVRLERAFEEFCDFDTYYNNETINNVTQCSDFYRLFSAVEYSSCVEQIRAEITCDEDSDWHDGQ